MKTGAVVLAAGKSQISNIPMLKNEMDTLREAGISPVTVVTGHEKDDVMKELVHRKVSFVNNSRYKNSSMMTSIRLGIEDLRGQCDKVVIVPADVPSFRKETIEAVTEADGDLVIPAYQGETGHPVCLDMSKADILINYRGRSGMRGLIESGKLATNIVDVEDPGILMEADSSKALAKTREYLRETLVANPMEVTVRVGLGRTDAFFDEEMVYFLKKIEETGSMNRACKELEMAYSRGWKSVKYAESQLGFPLIEKQTGGRNGGGSALTEEGLQYIAKYEKLRKRIEKYAKKHYKLVFGEDKEQ
ncbi:MAG: NTP transferase domain-containing protein [Anaerovoracaceae bacterium]|jgi:molybdate transport repressor ModE-like protein